MWRNGANRVSVRNSNVENIPPGPADSAEHEGASVREYAGLRHEPDAIEARTAGQVGYVGERHSQQDGAGVAMSLADDKFLRTIATEARIDGMPGVRVMVNPGRNFAFFARAG